MTTAGERQLRRLSTLAAAAGLALASVAFARRTAAILAYPWDWAPDEGLALEAARRLLSGSVPLYARETVPYPWGYTPLLPLLLSPFTETARPLLAARLLLCVFIAVVLIAGFVVVRRQGSLALALVAVALLMAPLDTSGWLLIVRTDGPMIALWLAGSMVAMPSRLQRGADRLSWRRALLGAGLLLAAVLVKPTAVAHGAPLVLGWLLVDTASAARLLGLLAAAGGLSFALLQASSSGAFLRVMGLFAQHPYDQGLVVYLLALVFRSSWPLLAFAAAGLFVALARRQAPWRDAAVLLWIGGIAVLPAAAKIGAWTNYFVPVLLATAILGSRWWASASRERPDLAALGALCGAAAVAAVLPLQRYPAPSPEDELTARAFYSVVRERGAPLLATYPDYAYFLLRQPVEVEGHVFQVLTEHEAPGTERVLEGLRRGRYPLVVALFRWWPKGEMRRALDEGYRPLGTCSLRYVFGLPILRYTLLVPVTSDARFAPIPGARCDAAPAPHRRP